jgi:hypothetical protein
MTVSASLVLSCISVGTDPKEFVARSLLSRTHINAERPGLDDGLSRFLTLLKQLVAIAVSPKFARETLKPGRLVFLKHDGLTWGWSSIAALEHGNVAVIVSAVKDENFQTVPCADVHSAFLAKMVLPTEAIWALSDVALKAPIVASSPKPAALLGVIDRIVAKFGAVPLYRFENVRLPPHISATVAEFVDLEKRLQPNLSELCRISEANPVQTPQFDETIDSFLVVLREFDYLGGDGGLLLKGRVAANLHVEEPLAISELLFSGFFAGLAPAALCVAVVTFVESPPEINKIAIVSVSELWAVIKRGLRVLEASLSANHLPALGVPRKRLMPFMHTFLERKSLSATLEVFDGLGEGIAVRILKRTRELLGQCEEAANLMGVGDLAERFNLGKALLVSGGDFDSSLYRPS